MKNKKTLIILIFVFVVLIGGAYILYSQLGDSQALDQLSVQQQENSQSGTEKQDSPKTLAPDFTVYDADGNEVKLHDFIGKPIVLNFWASWCGPCQMEMPDFHEKYLELGNAINFLMVNMTTGRENLESAKNFIAEKEYTFPVFYDTKSDAAVTYGAYSLPTTYFIDAKGYVIAQATGAIDGKTLLRGIDMINKKLFVLFLV
ncbi:MAG: TlpA family protein disulfide reductase [Clostridia bacterium]|nr:TlpA family protein disulfide reductase [Clostridia bacterium]